MNRMDDARVDRERKWIGCLIAVFGVVVLVVVLCSGTLFYATLPPSPQSVFERETGLNWPPNASIVSTGDDHRGLLGDGEFHVVFTVDDETVAELLSNPSNWRSGPVPIEIGLNCSFGTNGVSAMSIDGGTTHYTGNPELEDVLGSSEVIYTAHERCCDTIEWHNGTLLIVDPRHNKVWLAIWDF
ncbi:MAG: hypothetical protein AAGI63_09665 [Planctomycetota bacterium]